MKCFYQLLMLLALAVPAAAENPYDPLMVKAKAGDAGAQYVLATMYFNGQGVEKNAVEAFQWLKRAAEQNHTKAQFQLASLYQQGVGTPKDLKLAAQWYEKAALSGMTKAQFQIGILYGRGEGVERNYAESWFWLSVVYSKNPDPKLREMLDGIEDRMFASEKLEAKVKLEDWNKAHPPTADGEEP